VVVFIFLFADSSLLASTPESLTYEAGVVEFNYGSQRNITSDALLISNLRHYLEIMENAPSNLDIIVFPELTLNSFETALEVPEPEENISPCDNGSFAIESTVKQISCAAKNFSRYVVINIVTKVICPDSDMIAQNDPRNCSDRNDGFSYYNTNIVFDRSGTVISRYRKFNLFGERVDKPYKPSMVYFDTDFGVRFGQFICFDLQFRYPALELVRTYNITDIVFPSMWYSELPFLTAVQLQKYWAYVNNVNLLAAGSNNPAVASTGTGIYAGSKGSLISVMERTNNSTLYTATVPKRGIGDHIQINEQIVQYTNLEMASLDLWRDQLEPYSIRFLEDDVQMAPNTSNIIEQCHGDLCCTFDYSAYTMLTGKPYYRLAFVAYHGKRTFSGLADAGVVVCAVIACQANNVASCGIRNETFNFATHWHKLEVSGKFPYGNQYNYMPNTLDTSIMPFGVNEINYEQKMIESGNGHSNYYITMGLSNNLRHEFYTFGIYGRDFNLDIAETEAAASTLQISSLLIVGLIAAFKSDNLF